MLARYGKIGLAALSLTALGLVAFPTHASAQDNKDGDPASGSSTDPANKKIDLDLESTNLYYGLKLLFSQIKANFTIDESLKSLTVTAHLSQVPFRIALETLLKSTGTPLTYKFESGIYSVVPKVEGEPPSIEPGIDPLPVTTLGSLYKYGFIRPNNLSAIDIVQAFRGVVVTVGYGQGNGQNGQNGPGGIGGGLGGGGLGGFGSGGQGGLGGGFGGQNGGYGGMNGGYGGNYGSGGYGSGSNGNYGGSRGGFNGR